MEKQVYWWEHAVFYQIYPRSFQDSNGDGIGDLRGIIQKLDYLQDLGIDAIWISPFYESPQVDFGYDISNHKAIDPCFGSMADFDDLILEANHRNIKIVVDIILNHTSDQHPFFIESRASRTAEKRDWYIWRDGRANGQPPNNWEGFERTSWTLDDATQQYYYHFFYRQQPDLNWTNPDVIQEMFSICDFWLKKGVAGLRLDAINYLIEDPDLRDNPIVEEVPDYIRNVLQFKQLPIHTIDHPKNHDILKQLRQHTCQNHPNDPLLIGEVWVESPQKLNDFYGTKNDELQLPFNFFLSSVQTLSATAFRDSIQAVEDALGDRPTTVVLSNHDLTRANVRYGNGENSDAIAKLLATMLLTLRGIPFIYYGEEIGMVDAPPNTLDEVLDSRGKIRWPDYKGRDGCRTPMQWNSNRYAGFSEHKPWYKVSPDYITRNVDLQLNEADSILHYFKSLISLRKSIPALHQGSQYFVGNDPNILIYVRQWETEQLMILLNLSQNSYPVEIPETISGHCKLSTHPEQCGQIVSQSQTLAPYEGRIVILEASHV